MGCASSSPLVASGKEFIETTKESADELVHKGEHMIHDVGETAKDGFTSGVGHVKEAMSSALETAENSVGSVFGKISDTISGTKSEVKDAVDGLEHATEESMHKANDSMVEAVSEAETVLASEAEHAEDMLSHAVDDTKEVFSKTTDHAKEAVSHTAGMAFEKVDSIKDEVGKQVKSFEDDVKETLEIEDMEETLDMLEKDVSAAEVEERKVEDIVKRLPTPAPSPPPELEAKKQESPTFWEARADAILEQRMKSIEIEVPAEIDHLAEVKIDSHNLENDLELEDLELDLDRPKAEDHLGEKCENIEKLSMKSFILSE